MTAAQAVTEALKALTAAAKADRHTLPATAFAALLARAGTSQAGFARLAGLTPRQVNNWCRGRAAVPSWAAVLAVLLEVHSPEAITLLVEEAVLAWHDTQGVPPGTDAVRLAVADPPRPAAPPRRRRAGEDQGGVQRTRIDAACAQASATPANRRLGHGRPPPRP